MPEFNLKESITTSLSAQEPWPDNVKLFQPYEVEQILLPDNASCLAVQAFLKMCNLPFEVEMRWNAEFMSPSGRVPFIKCGAFVVSELEPIVQFAANKGATLCARLTTEEKAEMRAYMSLITNVLVNAELYISWLDNDTFNAVTKVRNSSVYPWPLGWIQTRSKRNMVAKRLKALHWHDKTLNQVLADVEQCCNSLSQRLGDKDYFFGVPTSLDALIFGHVRALLGAVGPKAALMIKPITSALLNHMLRIATGVQMKLTPQEEYLVLQASLVSCRRRLSPVRSEKVRGRRTRTSIKPSHESLPCREVLGNINVKLLQEKNRKYQREFLGGFDTVSTAGFKPFASKQIALTVSKNGNLTCEYEGPHRYSQIAMIDDAAYAFINQVLETIIAKVAELARDETEKDFDFVVCHKFEIAEKASELLDTIDENSTLPPYSEAEDVIKIIDSETDDEAVVVDDGNVLETGDHAVAKKYCESKPESGAVSEESTTSGRNMSSDSEHDSIRATFIDSRSTVKMPSNEEISVENLLEYLMKKNTDFRHFVEVADVD